MSERARALADRLERANEELVGLLERCSDEQWQRQCQDEGWTVAATARHVATNQEFIAGLVQTVANGGELPAITSELIDQRNAEAAAEFAACDRGETIDLLRQSGAAAVELVRGLDDEQLDRAAPAAAMGGALISAQRLVEGGLIGHTQGHGTSIRAALGE